MRETGRRITRSPEADDDLGSSWLYGANEWSPEQADKHLFEIESICDRLLDDPALGRPRDELIVGV
jgi:plasmid stabilization system protein ParE